MIGYTTDTYHPRSGVTTAMHQLEIRHLTVDIAAQRQLDDNWVSTIAADFRPDALGVITCSWRDIDSPTIHVVDGQHRVAAARQVGYAGKIDAHVYCGLTLPEEAALFRRLNAQRLVRHSDLFLVRVTEGDKVAAECVKILGDYGWKVHSKTSGTTFSATSTLERMYLLDPAAARSAIRIATDAWGHTRNAVNGTLVHGITLVLHRYGAAVDGAHFTHALRAIAGSTPDGLIADGRALRILTGGSPASAMAEVLVKAYNKGKTTRALPPWRS